MKPFLKYAEDKMDSEFHAFFIKAQERLLFYQQHPELIKKKTMEKLVKANKEYGDPTDNIGHYEFQKEMDEEIVDLVFGWPIVSDFQEEYVRERERTTGSNT